MRPAARRQGRRMYGVEELRRLVFLRSAQGLGIPLDTAGTVLDAPGARWREEIAGRLTALDDLIARARMAQEVLRHVLDCPAEHPVRECGFLMGELDRLLDGASLEQLATEQEEPGTSRRPVQPPARPGSPDLAGP